MNVQFYPIVRKAGNISPNNLRIVDMKGDDNYLFRSISRFIFGTEELYLRVR